MFSKLEGDRKQPKRNCFHRTVDVSSKRNKRKRDTTKYNKSNKDGFIKLPSKQKEMKHQRAYKAKKKQQMNKDDAICTTTTDEKDRSKRTGIDFPIN